MNELAGHGLSRGLRRRHVLRVVEDHYDRAGAAGLGDISCARVIAHVDLTVQTESWVIVEIVVAVAFVVVFNTGCESTSVISYQ